MKHLLIAALTIACMPPAIGAPAENWTAPQAPARIHGETYYVGTEGISAVLIHTGAGLILLDGTLAKSAPIVEANIRTLGFRVEDIKFILNSHAHFDHAGGIAQLQRDSGATVLASPSGAAALRAGRPTPDDPQAGYPDNGFPAVAHVRDVADGEIVRLGEVAVTAHFTPGHTPGSTTWTWRSCAAEKCLDIVYADSLNSISAPGFHYLADARHGDLTVPFRRSIETVAALPCDILISVHPDATGVDEKLRQSRAKPAENPFIEAGACKRYADTYGKMLDERIEQEKAAPSATPLKP